MGNSKPEKERFLLDLLGQMKVKKSKGLGTGSSILGKAMQGMSLKISL